MAVRIFWASDSTVKYNHIETYPQTGIGQALYLYLKDDVAIYNRAENGRSTKRFINEGRLEKIDSELKKGDFFFIEFGHNDWNSDPLRHTEAFGDFQENLMKFINTARVHQSYPVLITPVYCRFYDDSGKLKENVHFNYPAAMIDVANKEKVPLIDLCEKSKKLISETDSAVSQHWFMNLPPKVYAAYPEGKKDDAHFQYGGAVIMAGIVARELKNLGGKYAELVREQF